MHDHRLALPVGTQLETFRLEAILGKGGFGITYVALDVHLGKRVAIKELLPDSIATRANGLTVVPHSSSQNENWQWARERFLDEARILASFSHPAIVGVHRIIEAHGTIYLVMDFIEGESYETRLRRIGREPDAASLMAVVSPILDGLREVHAKGLLHRDIKPDNILISQRGQPVLIDFGSARASVGATMTMTSIVTHGYSPIEQYQTKGKMGPWTDIYAVGAMMCRAMTGEKPPVAADRVLDDEFRWLTYQNSPGFSEPFRKAVDSALGVRTEERPQRIADWAPHLGMSTSVNPPIAAESTLQTAQTQQTPHQTATHTPTQNRPQAEPLSEPKSLETAPSPTKPKKPVLAYALIAVALVLALVFVVRSIENNRQAAADEDRRQAKAKATRKADEEKRLAAEERAKQEAEAKKIEEEQRIAEEKVREAKRLEEKRTASLRATKDGPFVNSLGMKFVPVPDTKMLFSIWETRVSDYETFSQATGRRVEKPDFSQTPNDPVCMVGWDDAKAFCAWLTEKERGEGKITRQQTYRLPTDAEWSVAVGLPSQKTGYINDVYPWGTQWPTPTGAGNYDPALGVDTFAKTSPSGSFSENWYGLYIWEAMCGNGARIGLMGSKITVFCGAGRGSSMLASACFPRIAATSIPTFVASTSDSVVCYVVK